MAVRLIRKNNAPCLYKNAGKLHLSMLNLQNLLMICLTPCTMLREWGWPDRR